ncbi:hypothetical protein ELQ92_11810 [Labedella populi]|uniref:4'-phosphopantetheinyl transferase superfamily protein n=1 Tax=Labedella populi TaxID=2498850 RepID=A0A3S4DZ26_9MICO|nr:hypothetical protein [Labedella populi]RWZ59519.1 hypothetical protein ELQ92_11810 [Labedella populi]
MDDDPAVTVTDLSSLFPGGDGPLVVLSGRWVSTAGVVDRRRRARDLLRAGASRLWGATADPVVAARCSTCGGDHGRPVITDRRTGLWLPGSVTHAGATTLVALGPAAVGIDAEAVDGDPSRFDAIRQVTGRSAAAVDDGIEALRLWTTVEAVLKADGRGLEVDPRRVRIDGPAGTPGSSARVGDGPLFALRGIARDGLVVTLAVPER